MLTEPDMRSRIVLSDGTPFDDLIDIERREVSVRLLTDPEVYELELQRLFDRSWILVAHESEIPHPGDYVMRSIGDDSVIVIRRPKGNIEILLNQCTHRGMQICRAEKGNAKNLTCPYHNFVFDTDGRFLGAPFEKEMYGDGCLDKPSLALDRARVGVYTGLVFGTWDPDAPSIDDFLGDFRWYIDSIFGRTDSGLEVVGAPQRFIIHANWKTAGEQFAGDGYHTVGLHRSIGELGIFGPGKGEHENAASWGLYGIDVSTRLGHGLRCLDMRAHYASMPAMASEELSPLEKLAILAPAGLPRELVPELAHRFDEQALRSLTNTPPTIGGMFPNVGVFAFYGPLCDAEGSVASNLAVRTYVPKGIDTFEYCAWVLVERDGSDEYKKQIREATIRGGGVSGIFDQDDAEAWPAMQKAARGVRGRKSTMKYQALLGEHRPDDWAGGGLVYEGFTKDDNQWNWWMRYREFMLGNPW